MWQPLKKGDLIDVIAPGFGIPEERLHGAVQFLHSLDLKARVPQDIFGEDIICGQSDDIRLKHLKSALLAKDSRAIWCLRGGYGAIRLIDSIAKLRKPAHAKLLIGYSDIVTLHNFLNQFWKWPTLHGPLLDRLGQNNLPKDQVNELVDVIFGRKNTIVHKNLLPMNAAAHRLKSRAIHGKVYGGNLAVTQTFLGTRYEKIPQNAILFFEDVGERGYRVDRMLFHLRQAGYFAHTRAIVFGEFYESQERSGEDRVPAVLQRFADEMKIPVLKNLQAGHGDNQRTVPLATSAQLARAEDADKDGDIELRIKAR